MGRTLLSPQPLPETCAARRSRGPEPKVAGRALAGLGQVVFEAQVRYIRQGLRGSELRHAVIADLDRAARLMDTVLDRLSICALLAAGADWVEFATVRDTVGVSDSVLSKQSRALEHAGYLEVRKGAIGRRPRTWFRLTDAGWRAFNGHVAALQRLAELRHGDAA